MLRTLIALIAAALFTGAALAVSLAEPGMRGRLERRIGGVQLCLALVSVALGGWAWWRTCFTWLLAGAVLIGVAFLISLAAGRSALASGAATHAAATPAGSGGAMPALRTALGLASIAAYLMAFVQP